MNNVATLSTVDYRTLFRSLAEHIDSGNEKIRRILRGQPRDESGVRARFPRFADGIRVQHEIHSRMGLTRSSGMRGGCQSVVPRMDSYHAINFRAEPRALRLRLDRRGGLSEDPLD